MFNFCYVKLQKDTYWSLLKTICTVKYTHFTPFRTGFIFHLKMERCEVLTYQPVMQKKVLYGNGRVVMPYLLNLKRYDKHITT